MRVLGIDWGEVKVGLAIADGSLAEPWKTLKGPEIKKLERLIRVEKIDKVVVGVSEGESGQKAKAFGENLKGLGVEVDFQDETLSTADAQRLSVEAGIKRSKRKSLQDAFAAAVMLQSYLERFSNDRL